MEMPNVKPATLTQELLQAKYDVAKNRSYVNYSFFMGASNDNLDEVLKTNHQNVCGVKIFMGSSTGNMLVDKEEALEGLFKNVDMLIATHCEDEATVRKNMAKYKAQFGDKLDASYHPIIRNVEACYLSSNKAVEMAKKYNTRLHILHISTAKETELFDNSIPLASKRITAEACVHHLTYSSEDYAEKGNLIKCNPAIKSVADRDAVFDALLNDKIDIIATDHAPHTWEEKTRHYLEAPSGLPLVQHSLDMMMMHVNDGKLTLEKMVEKMCHAPAECFQVKDRGFLREGYKADIVIYDPKAAYTVTKENIKYKCGWSTLEGKKFDGSVHSTIVNGRVIYQKGFVLLQGGGERLLFDRK
jgi:dihydroorotase